MLFKKFKREKEMAKNKALFEEDKEQDRLDKCDKIEAIKNRKKHADTQLNKERQRENDKTMRRINEASARRLEQIQNRGLSFSGTLRDSPTKADNASQAGISTQEIVKPRMRAFSSTGRCVEAQKLHEMHEVEAINHGLAKIEEKM